MAHSVTILPVVSMKENINQTIRAVTISFSPNSPENAAC